MNRRDIHVITELENYLVQPNQIPISGKDRMIGTFGQSEVEDAARLVLIFCQKRDNWEAFTPDDISVFLSSYGASEHIGFEALVDRCWIVLINGRYHVTHEFVTRLFCRLGTTYQSVELMATALDLPL